MRQISTILTFAAVLSLTACWRSEDLGDLAPNEYKPLELTTKGSEFVKKGEAFTFEFIERINAKAGKDYIVSPLSMQFLLGMILNGAQGETAEQIAYVLGYGADDKDAVNDFAQSMLTQLPRLDRKTGVAIANAIYVDDGWPLKDAYKSDVGQYYKAEIENLDFGNNEESLKVINGWCKKHTNGMIDKVLDEVDPSMLCYLLNALYFKGDWTDKFSVSNSEEEEFVTEGSCVIWNVTMMKQTRNFEYTENKCFQAVRLPYGNGAYTMTVLLPKAGYGVGDAIATLRASSWQEFRYSFETREVDLWLPRFETKFGITLNDMLKAMGMPYAFDAEKADFSLLSDFALRLSFVQQHAAIKVDEEGTEAAAVSSAGFEKNAAVHVDKAIFHANHSFLYLISESSTGVVLFAGRFGNN